MTGRRGAILDAACRLFEHYGPLKTTVADIAREAAVGVGTVYLEFRNKDEILATLSGRRYQDVLAEMERAWSGEGSADARLAQVLDARFVAFLRAGREHPHGADLLGCACPALANAQSRYLEAERALLVRCLREGVEAGELDGDPPSLATAVLLAYRAFAPPLLFEKPDALRAALPQVHQLVRLGLRRRSRRR